MMKIIYISPSPPNDMERIRSLHILKSLKRNGAKITLVTLYYKKQEQYIKEASSYVDNIVKIKYNRVVAILHALLCIFLPIPMRVGYLYNFKLKKFLQKNMEQYDVAYIKRLRLAQYKKYVKAKKIYIDITDSLTKYYQRLYKNEKSIKKLFYLEEYLKLRYYEIKVCEKNQNIVICSEDDKKYIENISKKTIGHIHVVENILEPKNWINQNLEIKEPGKRTKLVFFGVMNYKPNIEAVLYIIHNIMPKLDLNYQLEIIGPKVSNTLKKLETERIKFLGYVSSVKEELKENDIFICPIFNRGRYKK